jgi:hypothetical protein
LWKGCVAVQTSIAFVPKECSYMKKKSLIAVAAALCFATSALAQSDGTIGIYTDAVGTSCCITAMPGNPATAHVVVTLAGASGGGGGVMGGITGAEFRIEIPNAAGYFFIWMGNPAFTVALGPPLDPTPADPMNDNYGTTMGSVCQPMGGGMVGDDVSLGTIQIINVGTGGPTPMRIKRKLPPSNEQLRDCPLLVLCDMPNFTQVCLGPMAAGEPDEPIHFQALLNTPDCGGTAACGPVAVEPVNWSAVKSLFR